MDEAIRRALARRNVIDITTTGRRTGQSRRIEIVFHSFDGRIYITGMPTETKRAWLANLEEIPAFTFHLKGNVGTPVADLPALARVITNESERRAIFARVIETAWHQQDLATMVDQSPLIEVTIEGLAA